MDIKKKQKIRKLFGLYLKARREKVLKIQSVRQLSFSSNIDYSKLVKIEKGLVNFQYDTLIEIALTYQINPKNIFDFTIEFWKEEEEK